MATRWVSIAASVPRHDTHEDAWQWCVAQTVRDVRAARAKRAPMSRLTAERLFARRWWRCAGTDNTRWRSWLTLGRQAVADYAREPQSGAW